MGRDPTEPFWLAVTIANADDTISADLSEGVEGTFDTEAEAADAIKEMLREYGSEGFVYRCIPMTQIKRQPRVTRLQTRALIADGATE